jgi:calcineurin-like phosphoesterase family protein
MDDIHFFIGDTHFAQANIHFRVRPEFNSAKEHDDYIHKRILETGNKTRTLWLTGDTFLKPSSFWRLEEYRLTYQQVNIVLGNHCHSALPGYASRLKGVNVMGSIKRFGFWLSHLPVHPVDLERGKNIHAHNHNRVTLLDHTFKKDPNYFCTSAEVIDYKPISLSEIKKRFKQQSEEYNERR